MRERIQAGEKGPTAHVGGPVEKEAGRYRCVMLRTAGDRILQGMSRLAVRDSVVPIKRLAMSRFAHHIHVAQILAG